MNDPLASQVSGQQEITQRLLRNLPGYTPEWTPASGTKAHALLEVLARYQALLEIGQSGLAERNLLAMLDTFAIPLLPAQAARAPIVFQLTPNCSVDVNVSADSQLAAQPAPSAPSPLASSTATNPNPLLFFTEQTITVARANLKLLYSVDPGSDSFANHSENVTEGFTIFGDMRRTEHAIYLAHDRLFKLGGRDITLLLQCSLEVAPQNPLDIHWQYLSEVGWITLQLAEEEDTTRGLTRDGQIALRLTCGPDAKQETFHGRTSYWLRGTLKTPVIRGENLRHNPLTINDLRIRVKFKKENLLPEIAFAENLSLDVSKDFYPFGQQPITFNTFYLASTEVFQRGGARVHIDINLSQPGKPKGVDLKWEYYSNSGWQDLGVEPGASGQGVYKFDIAPKDAHPTRRVSFNCPSDWQESAVNGVKKRWMRVRIADGNFGNPLRYETQTTGTPPVTTTSVVGADLQAPVISRLAFSYSYLTNVETLDYCLSYNDFQFTDHTDDAVWPDRQFDPFWPVADDQPALHFGFDQRLPSGLVSLYVHLPGAEELVPNSASAFSWEYLSPTGWLQLSVRDETNGFKQSGMLQFIGPPDAVTAPSMGNSYFHIRARLKVGSKLTELPVSGLWLNSTWASHRVRVERELLGVADGTPSQGLRFVNSPVLAGESVEIREWTGTGEGWQLIAHQVAGTDIRYEREPLTQRITTAWVRWRERPHLYDATAKDRVYVLERATGFIRFGDGTQGMIPPANSQIIGNYITGGGAAGNAPANTIIQLRSAVPFIASITNPVAAAGGADTESVALLEDRAPQQLRHKNRAITAADIEWNARDASPEVARAHCLAITGPEGHAQRGWFTLIILPRSLDPQPWPTPELQRRVATYLRQRVPAAVVQRLRVVEPNYVALNIAVELVPQDPQSADKVEAQVRENLNRFLHPLAGGVEGKGWGFGASVYLSNIALVIESTQGVDYARNIRLFVNGGEHCEEVKIPRDALVCAGSHEIKLTLGTR